MPTYEYHCEACDHDFEEFQGIKDPVLRKCPACGKLKLRRLIGAGAAVVFKGSGFYQTDYRSESYKKGAAESQKSSSSATATSTATASGTSTSSSSSTDSGKSSPAKKPK